jgi:hypothetical protein
MPTRSRVDRLRAENNKLRAALAALIPWAGESPDGPRCASAEAKQRNRTMFEEALRQACSCFPDDYNSLQEIVESN